MQRPAYPPAPPLEVLKDTAMKPLRWSVVCFAACLVGFAVARDTDSTYPPPATVKANFLKLLDRPRVPLDPQVLSSKPEGDDLIAEHIRLNSEKKPNGEMEQVPMLLIRPKKEGKYPAVVVLHGTGGTKDEARQREFMVELAKHGMIGAAIDARYHGERSGGAPKAEAYNAAIVRAWRAKPGEPQEHPWYFDTCWDIWRTIDYLDTRADVDPARIGMIGFSMGGIETWLAASVDDRVKVVVPAISIQSFRWSLDNDAWQGRARTIKAAHDAATQDLGEKEVNARVCQALWTKVIPGCLDEFDCPSMVRLFAPSRPMLVLSGELDPNCPLGGGKIATVSAEKAYGSQAGELLKVDIVPGGGHKVTDEQRKLALDWFQKWLKP